MPSLLDQPDRIARDRERVFDALQAGRIATGQLADYPPFTTHDRAPLRYTTTTLTGGLIAVVEWRDGCQHVVKLFPASPQNDDRARALAVKLNREAGCYA